MHFQQNVWYVAALPEQIGSALARRIIVGKSILLFRRDAGQIAALADRCPHRFAPLSMGKRLGDVIQCGYHGLEFDASGACVHNPHGNAISPHMRVQCYPVVERHGLIWIWPGDPKLSDSAQIPDLSHMEAGSGNRTVHSYLNTDYRYDILVDNLLDLSHAEYLHNGSFSGGPARTSTVSVAEHENEVVIDRVLIDAPPAPFYASLGERVDMSFNTRWRPGNVMSFENWITPTGGPFEQGRRIRFSH